jgi:hypothetical protein
MKKIIKELQILNSSDSIREIKLFSPNDDPQILIYDLSLNEKFDVKKLFENKSFTIAGLKCRVDHIAQFKQFWKYYSQVETEDKASQYNVIIPTNLYGATDRDPLTVSGPKEIFTVTIEENKSDFEIKLEPNQHIYFTFNIVY